MHLFRKNINRSKNMYNLIIHIKNTFIYSQTSLDKTMEENNMDEVLRQSTLVPCLI